MISTRTLVYKDARRAIDAIVAEAARLKKSVVVVVADPHGEAIALARTEGAPLPSIVIASNKAWTAARTGKPSAEIGKRAADDVSFDIAYYGDARFCGWGGGIPVRRGGKVVGSVAVSGLSQEEDVALATMGAAAI